MEYELDPKVFKKLSKPEQKFFSNQKNLKDIWSPEALKQDRERAYKIAYKSMGLWPKDL